MFLTATSVGVMLLLGALAALIVGAPHAGQANAQGASKCTLKTIQGAWVFEEQGLVKDGDKMVPWVAAGVWIFDGAGKSEGIYSAGVNGEAIDRQKPFTATYELKTGCVFRSVDSLEIVYDVYVLEPGTAATYFAGGVSGTMFKR
jgi:hypothetical protein